MYSLLSVTITNKIKCNETCRLRCCRRRPTHTVQYVDELIKSWRNSGSRSFAYNTLLYKASLAILYLLHVLHGDELITSLVSNLRTALITAMTYHSFLLLSLRSEQKFTWEMSALFLILEQQNAEYELTSVKLKHYEWVTVQRFPTVGKCPPLSSVWRWRNQ